MSIETNIKLENDFYYTNFLTLFNKSKSIEEISVLAQQASKKRISSQNSFDNRTDALLSTIQDGKSEHAFKPHLQGWRPEKIHQLRAQYGGVLIGLFHYGPHRHVLMDLACMGIDIASPIAKRAYWKQYELRNRAPGNFANCMKLHEVEKETVGKDLFLSLRAGRVGVIYVDGNMGPESYQEGESTLVVNFFDRKIKVKTGIARLAQAFNYPILPVFTSETDDIPRVQLGEAILPRDKTHLSKPEWQLSAMQSIYKELEHQVSTDASQWEFAKCMHRWLTKNQSTTYFPTENESQLYHEDIVQINRKNVSVMQHGKKSFWIDVNAEKGFTSPDFMPNLFQYLESDDGIKINQLLSLCNGSDQKKKVFTVLNQLHNNKLIEANH